MRFGPGDLVFVGTGLLLAGLLLLTGVLGTSSAIHSIANFVFTGGVTALVFGIPWLLLSRLVS